ncbi:hypothetical protein PR202_gb03544 [Eleusine coracana subsp. coracana]|uniref:Uncharacterized protein n=1 Tax=Eleusine coracana subsp. coracana TaxID=191504 RepID=A0AAV5DZP9_ELECO|nr:hypothetical protein PR202_gb03544 [Eleusine coracana subsp. coracana]
MRSAEQSVPGVLVPQEKGGGFSAGGFMESAAQYNQAVGAVQPGQASEAAAKQGINITQDPVPGGRIVTEFVAGQVLYVYICSTSYISSAGPCARVFVQTYVGADDCYWSLFGCRWWGSTPWLKRPRRSSKTVLGQTRPPQPARAQEPAGRRGTATEMFAADTLSATRLQFTVRFV